MMEDWGSYLGDGLLWVQVFLDFQNCPSIQLWVILLGVEKKIRVSELQEPSEYVQKSLIDCRLAAGARSIEGLYLNRWCSKPFKTFTLGKVLIFVVPSNDIENIIQKLHAMADSRIHQLHWDFLDYKVFVTLNFEIVEIWGVFGITILSGLDSSTDQKPVPFDPNMAEKYGKGVILGNFLENHISRYCNPSV